MNFLKRLLDIYKKGLQYDSLERDFVEMQESHEKSVDTYIDEVSALERENTLLHNDLLVCSETHLQPVTDTFDLEVVLRNFKKKVQPRAFKYALNGDGNKVDVRFAFRVESDELIHKYCDLIQKEYSPKTPLECVEAVSKYFIYKKKPKYVTDDKQFGKREYWNTADKFLSTFKGDCEDTAIAMHLLIKELLVRTGNEAHYGRLYLHVHANLLEPHANNIWLHEDGWFYTIESTIDIKDTFRQKWLKVPLANDSFYKRTWGIASTEKSYIGSTAIKKNFRKV